MPWSASAKLIVSASTLRSCSASGPHFSPSADTSAPGARHNAINRYSISTSVHYRRGAMPNRGNQTVITNRKARHDYYVLESYECGIVLKGAEVKSIRNGRANLQDGYARVDDGEVWLHGMHISPYEFSRADHDPVRKRKLLLHHKEIAEITR